VYIEKKGEDTGGITGGNVTELLFLF